MTQTSELRPSEAQRFAASASIDPAKRSRTAVVEALRRPLVAKISNAEDESTGEGYEIFQFRKRKSEEMAIEGIRRDIARHPVRVERQLRRKNLDPEIGDEEVSDAVVATVKATPSEYWLYSGHVGWRANCAQAVLHDRVIGEAAGERKIKPPLWGISAISAFPAKR
jgi:hypothetical protein